MNVCLYNFEEENIVKIALCQLDIKFENKIINKQQVIRFILDAKAEDVDLIIFPEMTLTGFSMNIEITAESDNDTVHMFRDLCIGQSIAIGFGWVNKVNKKAENHYTIIDKTGNIISDYIKIHPFSFSGENEFFISGNSICKTSLNEINMSSFICYDLRFPEIFQIISDEVELIIVAANWPMSRREHWNTLLKARAIENQVYIAAVNCVGEKAGISYSGDSCIIDPNGNILEQAIDEEKLIIFSIDKNEVMRVREGFPLKNDRKQDYNAMKLLDL